MNDYDYLIHQLNLLIGFLDVSDEQVYHQIKKHDRFGIGITIEELYQNSYENYSSHISTSAFILGFSHFEDFLTKRIIKFLIDNPDKNTHKVVIKIIQEKGGDLISHLAFEEARRKTFSEKLKLIESNFPSIDSKFITDLKFANDIRNCIMHNNGIADNRVEIKYKYGDRIKLTSSDVNMLGLSARRLAALIWINTENETSPIVNNTI